MRALATAILALALLWQPTTEVNAAQSNSCKQCRDFQKRCMANYPGKTCNTEYDICMKSCRGKR